MATSCVVNTTIMLGVDFNTRQIIVQCNTVAIRIRVLTLLLRLLVTLRKPKICTFENILVAVFWLDLSIRLVEREFCYQFLLKIVFWFFNFDVKLLWLDSVPCFFLLFRISFSCICLLFGQLNIRSSRRPRPCTFSLVFCCTVWKLFSLVY